MAKHISNMNELEKALQPVMKDMVDTLAVEYLRSKGFSVRT